MCVSAIMVHSTAEWCEISRPKPAVVAVKDKKVAAVKNGRESKGAGSRRIFSPVFKLQVLDSYRQDADCQGNQRATARKYGIHRRQIQKWLQMETNLRLSVQKTSASVLNLSSAVRQPDPAKDCAVSSSSCSSSCSELEVKRELPSCGSSHSVHSPHSVHSTQSSHNEPIVDSHPATDTSGSVSDSEEYVNVDEITDSEDDADTSSCSSYENRDKALDFTSATLSKRRFYTADFKAHVLDAFRHDQSCRGNQRATARKFGIHRRQVQKWLNQEASIQSEPSNNPVKCSSSSTTCLDLSSHKRKLDEVEEVHPKRAKVRLPTDSVQESALCLVKHTDKLAKVEPAESHNNNGHYHHHILYPAAATLDHSYGSSALSYLKPEYPFCVYQPWHCCYQQILSARSGLDAAAAMLAPTSKAYSYAFNVKYEASYVDIPVQYGFGDSVPSKWLKENPLFLQGPPSPYPCP